MHPNGNDHVVHIEDLYKEYDGKVVLDNIDLSITKGELMTVVGPSGCGKSTLLKMILGQERPSSGAVLVNKEPVGFPCPERGVVYQKYSLIPYLTAYENVQLGRKLTLGYLGHLRRKEEVHQEVMDFIRKTRLEEHKDKMPHQLSGGQQQRVALAQALIMKPKIILMDEPFGALDSGTREQMQTLLLSLWEEFDMTVFFVTHDLEEAIFLGTRIIVLSQYYTDGRGDILNRGAKVVYSKALPRIASSTAVKTRPDFGKLVQEVRQEVFEPKHKKHVTEFNLSHPDDFQTLSDEESKK
jgi:NitT/TauT family transport system ATP-binding protein